MPATIGARIELDGAATFRQQLTQLNAGSKALAAEMKALQSSFTSEDSAEKRNAATKAQLNQQIDVQKQKTALLKSQLDQLGQAHANTGQRVSTLRQLVAEASDEFGEGSDEVNTFKAALNSAESEYRQQGNAINNMRTQLANAETAQNKMESELRQVDSALDGAASSADRFGDEMDSASRAGDGFSSLKVALGDLASNLIMQAVDYVKDLAGEMANASDSAQKFASSLQFAGFDSSDIDALTKSTQKYADDTVYDLGEIRTTTSALASNFISMGMSSSDAATQADKLTQAAGNLNAVAGGSSDTFSTVSQVMTQTAGAGKLTTENWNQLRDAIPGASGILQKALADAGAYTGDFATAMANGEITADEFNAAIMSLGFDDAAVDAATSTSTIEGAMGNLEASIVGVGSQFLDQFKQPLTDSISAVSDGISALPGIIGGAMSSIGTYMQPLTDALSTSWAAIQPVLQAVGDAFMTSISPALSDAAAHVQPIADGFMNLATQIASALGPAVQAVSPILQDLASILGSVLGTAFDIVLAVVQAVVTHFNNMAGAVIPALQAAWEVLGPTVTTVFNAIRTTVETVMNVVRDVIGVVMAAISGDWSGVWTGIQTLMGDVWTGIQSIVGSQLETIGTVISLAWNAIKGVTSAVWNAIKTAVTTPINAAKDAVSTAINAIKSTVTSVFNGVRSTVSSVWNGIKSAISNPINAARSAVQTAINAIRGAMNFSWSLPKLKLPHISITGSFSLVPPKAPKFGISWYKRAMDAPYALNGATIFGAMGGSLLGGGEAGREWIMGDSALQNVVRAAVGGAVAPSTTVNVYPSQGMDERELADLVARRIQLNVERTEAVWA